MWYADIYFGGGIPWQRIFWQSWQWNISKICKKYLKNHKNGKKIYRCILLYIYIDYVIKNIRFKCYLKVLKKNLFVIESVKKKQNSDEAIKRYSNWLKFDTPSIYILKNGSLN